MVDGSADVARFSAPAGIAVDEAGTLYVVDTRNYVIRKITAKGVVSTLAGTPGVQGTSDGKKGVGKFWAPTGVTFWNGALYVTDSGWSTLRKVSLTGEITTVAGGEFPTGISQDGTGRFAQFSNPLGLTVDGAGRLVIADNWSGLIRRVNSSYEVTTILGQAYGFVVDDGEGTAARFVSPTALATDTSGNVLVVQSVMPSVRRFDSKLVSRTLAGGFANLPSESGTGGFASFGDLTGVSAAPDGAVYVVDSTLNAIWKGVSVPNTAPKISKFVDKTIKEDKSLPPVPFTVSDAETPSYDLTVSATSSNTKLLASSAITLTQTAGAWQLTATPKPNTNGKTTVSVTVTDGGASSTEKFVLKVKAVNDPPVLGEIGSFVIAAGDTSETRSFTAFDPDGDKLTLKASSSNAALVSASGIVFGGKGDTRTLTVKPKSGKTGTAKITVKLSDGKLSASRTFTVKVVRNTPPTISKLKDIGTRIGVKTAKQSFTVHDAERDASRLTVTASSSNPSLIPDSSIELSGTGEKRSIAAKPKA